MEFQVRGFVKYLESKIFGFKYWYIKYADSNIGTSNMRIQILVIKYADSNIGTSNMRIQILLKEDPFENFGCILNAGRSSSSLSLSLIASNIKAWNLTFNYGRKT